MWWRGLDLNQRPSGYEPDELPDCSTPRWYHHSSSLSGSSGRHASGGAGCSPSVLAGRFPARRCGSRTAVTTRSAGADRRHATPDRKAPGRSSTGCGRCTGAGVASGHYLHGRGGRCTSTPARPARTRRSASVGGSSVTGVETGGGRAACLAATASDVIAPVASGHQARPSSAGHPRRLTYRDPSTVYRLSSTPADESTTSRGRLPPPPTPPDSLPVGSAPGRLGRAVPTLRDGQPAPGDQELRGAEQQVGVHLRVQLERDAGSLHHHIAARRQS